MIELVIVVVLISTLIVISWFDICYRRLPNNATYGLIVGGLVWALVNQAELRLAPSSDNDLCISGEYRRLSLPDSLAGCLSSFAIMFVVYSAHHCGGGDVKLVAGIGAFLGVQGGMLTICYAYIFAGSFAACLAVYKLGIVYCARAVLRRMRFWLTPETPEAEIRARALFAPGLPLAPFFSIGVVLVLWDVLNLHQSK